MQIPLVDLRRQYQNIKDEIDLAILNQIDKSEFIGGEAVKSFETNFSRYAGSQYCIGCANGTDAIELLLQALGIGKGDEVLVPAHTWISTSEAVTAVGATPVFVDCDPAFYTINIKKAKVTAKTKAVIVVHLYGLPAEMDEIVAFAEEHKLKLIEDCAQAHGALYKGKKVGTFGEGSTFSFYPGKNLGAYGDAGAVITDNAEIANSIRAVANHGQLKKHDHLVEGRNSRLDSIQASILNTKLKYIEEWTNKRIKIADYYSALLKEVNVKTPLKPNYSKHVYHIFAIQLMDKTRSKVMNHLIEKGIGVSVHYPKALPFLPPYNKNTSPDDFGEVYEYQEKIISLPIFPELTDTEIEYVVDTIKEIL